MAKEPERGYKANLTREILSKKPGSSNQELAEIFVARMKEEGYKEERELSQIAQAFSQARADAKRKEQEGAAAPVAAKVAVVALAPTGFKATASEEGPLMEALRAFVRLVG